MFESKRLYLLYLIWSIILMGGCTNNENHQNNELDKFNLVVLAPGHFHAALLQKYMYERIDSTVRVYAPEGSGIEFYLDLIKRYNNRPDDPTRWKEEVYKGHDYLQKMLQQTSNQDDIVVIAGNNKMKKEYIAKSIEAGMNVLADKPMAITPSGFNQLKKDFEMAKKNGVLLYDIMTERYAIHYILQKELAHTPAVFGQLKEGTLADPAIIFKSSHSFYKEVSGEPILRPAWFLDTAQQGEGIVDITTHLVDLIQWECFPKEILNYQKDIKMLSARRWPTILTSSQFKQVTQKQPYPDFLKETVRDSQLYVYSNGEMNYTIKGVHARVAVDWKFRASQGAGDTFYSTLKGTKANLTIRQGEAQNFKPVLYIEPTNIKNKADWEKALNQWTSKIQKKYPGVSLKENNGIWKVAIPDRHKTDGEQRFVSVVKKYLHYLEGGQLPEWEVSFMLAKYYTTTQAVKVAGHQ